MNEWVQLSVAEQLNSISVQLKNSILSIFNVWKYEILSAALKLEFSQDRKKKMRRKKSAQKILKAKSIGKPQKMVLKCWNSCVCVCVRFKCSTAKISIFNTFGRIDFSLCQCTFYCLKWVRKRHREIVKMSEQCEIEMTKWQHELTTRWHSFGHWQIAVYVPRQKKRFLSSENSIQFSLTRNALIQHKRNEKKWKLFGSNFSMKF